jgi:hypothetical protein
VAHAYVGDACALHGDGDRLDRNADDAERVFDALGLEAAGDESCAVDLGQDVLRALVE